MCEEKPSLVLCYREIGVAGAIRRNGDKSGRRCHCLLIIVGSLRIVPGGDRRRRGFFCAGGIMAKPRRRYARSCLGAALASREAAIASSRETAKEIAHGVKSACRDMR